jgi:hypothetical protein
MKYVFCSKINHEPILTLLNFQLQRRRCSMLDRFYRRRKYICLKKRTRLLVELQIFKALAL